MRSDTILPLKAFVLACVIMVFAGCASFRPSPVILSDNDTKREESPAESYFWFWFGLGFQILGQTLACR